MYTIRLRFPVDEKSYWANSKCYKYIEGNSLSFSEDMGIGINIFYLYKLRSDKALLLKLSRPGSSNANQNQENQAEEILGLKRRLLLEKYLEKNNETIEIFVGEFQGLPEGDALYEKHGTLNLKQLYYTKTKQGENWIYLSLAENAKEFWQATDEDDFADNGLKKSDLILPELALGTTDFVTEFDFDLSVIPNAYTLDLEDERRRK